MSAVTVAQRPIRTGAPRRHHAVYLRRRRAVYLRRRLAAVLTILVVVAAISGLWAMRSHASDGDAVEATVVVSAGETVWDIASAYTPAGMHPQAYVAEVLRYNDVDASAVAPGTVLRLPRG